MRPDPGVLRTPLLAAALLLCAIVVAYANAFSGAFQFDDFNVIVNNPRVHSWHAWWADLPHGIRPLLKFTYTLDWTTGLGAAGFHLANVLLHLANSLLVWRLSRHFVASHAALASQPAVPLLAAMLFALHPVNSEAVTYICGRSSALMTVFYLSGLLIYISGKAQRSQLYLQVLTPLCMLLALGVKETAATFPFALLLWEIYSGASVRSALRNQWSSWLLLLLSAVFFLLHGGYLGLLENSAALNSLSGNVATQTMAYAYLLRQWLVPLWLNIDPDLRPLHDFSGLLPHISVLLLALLLMLFAWRRRPWLSFALAWSLLQLVPLYLLLPRLDVVNERQLYLVGWPMALAAVAELSLWLKPPAFRWSAAALMVLLTVLTVMRNHDYRNEVALWEATVRLSPNKARAQNNLGYARMLAGNTETARLAFVRALQLDPQYYQARYNLLRLDEEAAEHQAGEPESATAPALQHTRKGSHNAGNGEYDHQ